MVKCKNCGHDDKHHSSYTERCYRNICECEKFEGDSSRLSSGSFNLSDKIGHDVHISGMLDVKYVREFIRRLKEELIHFRGVKQRLELIRFIDKLAGDKLV